MNREHILKSNLEFQKIIKNNKPFKYKGFIICLEKKNIDSYYFGFSVGKKIGNAVTRNKIKRQLRSIVSKKDYQNGFNCIIIVGRSILEKDFFDMEKDLYDAFYKLKIIKGEKNEKL